MFSSNASQVSGDAVYVEDVFSTYVYTGDGSSGRYVTNNIDLSGKGGMVWIKNRSADGHVISDTARGGNGNPIPYLQSNQTSAETVTTTAVDSFYGSGFLVNTNSSVNASGYNYASWTFRKQKKFFDVLTYTGTGGSQTINHNLGSTPGCIIVKCTSASSTNWYVYHRSLNDNSGNPYFVLLNGTAGQDTGGGVWGTPTSTQFTVQYPNASGQTYVAYLFAHDAGGFGLTGTDNVISCGYGTASGGAAQIDVTLGYEPQWIMMKNATANTGDWYIWDTMRGIGSFDIAQTLFPNKSLAENTYGTSAYPMNITSTGFSINTAYLSWGSSSDQFIYVAIRKGPMKVPTDATKVFIPLVANNSGGTVNTTNFPIDLQLMRDGLTGTRSIWSVDRLRGVGTTNTDYSTPYLQTASTSAETSSSITRGWDNTGFKTATPISGASNPYWNFRRAPSFMDVVCYSGNDVAGRTINHNLGVAPELIIVKMRSGPTNGSWLVYNAPSGPQYGLELNSTGSIIPSVGYWNNTSPTASVFTVGDSAAVNTSSAKYVAHLFATCAGVSKVGSYTGTGTTKQINCGFTAGARFILIKRTDDSGDWYVWDSARGIVSGNDPYLLLNSTAAEVTSTDYIDTYSAGFEISSTAPAAINASGGTYIFLAIA